MAMVDRDFVSYEEDNGFGADAILSAPFSSLNMEESLLRDDGEDDGNGEGYKDKEEEEEREEEGEREREREKGREDPPEIVSSLLRKKASSLTRAQTSVGLVKKKANPPPSLSASRSSLPSSPSRTFLRSSSSNAIARNSSSSAVLKPQPPSVKRRNSIGGIGVGVGAGGSSVAPPPLDTPPPQTPSRRNSLSNTTPRHTPLISSSDSRRASLSSFSSRSPLEVPKWASSSPLNLSSSFRSPSSSSSRMTTSMNQPPRSFSKTPETTTTTTTTTISRRQPSPSPQKAPSLSSKPSPKPTISRSPSSISSSPATHIKPSPSPSSGTFRNQKKPTPTLTPASSSGLRRSINSLDGSPSGISPRHASPSGISPRQSSATSRRLPSPFSSERSAPGGGAARRKSITPDIREPRSMPAPQVEAKAGDDLRLDLRGHKVRSLDSNGVNLSPKLEFVYLRDNKLSTLNGIDILRRVKVLDLSFNEFKGGGFEPLANCKMLQQLYLAGNQITSLSGLPELPNLEFLSVAQNKLKSLAMASQPKLQVLAASKNKISTLKGFPHLPALENLRLEENPISEMPHVEAASIILVGPTLKKFNDRDLVLEEQELARRYPSHTALCIRDGWDFCDVEDAAESTLKFLVAQWSDKLPPGHAVGNASVDHPFEEDPCSCYFSFVKKIDVHEDAGLGLRYQWFIGDKTPTNFMPIEGAQGEIYWPKHEDVGCCLKVECTAILNEIEYGPIFTISAPVSQGTGCPKVLDLVVEGDFIEGVVIQGRAKVAWCGGTPGKGIVSWLRRHENCSPVPINGADDNEYELTFDDVGATLLLMYTPVTAEGVRGEAHFATTSTVQPAPPRVSNVHVVGSPVEGSSIEGVGKYFGGKEGPSKYEWLREDPISGEFKLVSRGTATYILSEEDVGLRMMFIYTPVNSDGHHGDPVSAITIAVQQAPPKVTQLRIVGDVQEGNKVAVSAIVNGGVEGASRVQWFKTTTPDASLGDSNLEAISTSKIAKAFRIPLGAVGFYLVAKYTPVRSDGESGEPAIVFSDTKVEMLPPSLNFLSITGEFVEGETLTASYGYIGGHEGSSLYSWYMHESENDVGVAIAESEGLLQLQLSKAAVNKLISFRCTPVRDDGVSGETRSTMGQECARPGSPKLLSLQILGEPVEGNRLMADTVYWGGEEGASELQWFLTRPDGAQREIKGACSSQYTVRSEDIEGLLCVSCEPVRIDGARGPVAISQPIGPVLPAPPTCESLELCGQLVEGGRLSFKMIYKGGEKGSCLHKWFRQSASSRVHISSSETLDLTPDDIGSRIELVFTPVRKDGFSGTPQKVISDVVKDAEPLGISLVLPDCYEDVEAVPQKVYFGGCEGISSYTWFQLEEKLEGPEIPEYADFLSDSITYTPTLGDVGKYLLLKWTPTRNDGERGRPLLACSDFPVAPAFPSVKMVTVKEDSAGVYVGEGQYYGGIEGQSKLTWYREPSDGAVTPIPGATSKTYMVDDDDYTCRLIFGYVPVRQDGVVGQLVLSEPTEIIYPEMPRVQKLVLTGKAVEGEVLTALEVLPKSEKQQKIWDNYKKSVRYQWSRSKKPGVADAFDPLPLQRACSYKLRSEDIGFCMRCDCIVTDVFGRSMEPVSASTPSVAPGMPKVDKLEIEGLGYHTNLYAVRGIYSGGKEGKSMIQWFRAMAGSPDLIPIPGEIGRMYEANVDDVGYRLVAVYTPVREDNVEGTPASASTEPIAVEPDVAKEVKQRLEIGAVKFEALRDRDRSPMKVQQQQGLGSLERRILDVNRKRLKVVKPGSKTSFPNTEIRGSYAPPFHVELFRNDQHRMKIVIDSENEVDLMVQTRHIRDVIVLVLRGFAQRFNSTPLNLLLKM